MRASRWIGLLMVWFALAGCTSSRNGTFELQTQGGQSELSYPVTDRKPIGEISGPDLSGQQTLSLSSYRGQVVVLNFWGSWCGPCRLEADDLEAAATTLKSDRVQFLGVNVKDQQDAGRAFNRERNISYPSIFDPTGRAVLSLRGYPATAIPSTIVLDRQGRVAHIWLARVTREPLIQAVGSIAAEQ